MLKTYLRNIVLLIGVVNIGFILYLMYCVAQGKYKIEFSPKYSMFKSVYDYDGQTFLFILLMLVVSCMVGWVLFFEDTITRYSYFKSLKGAFILVIFMLITCLILYIPYKLIELDQIVLGLDSICLSSFFIIRCIHTHQEKLDYFLHCLMSKGYRLKELQESVETGTFTSLATPYVNQCNSFSDIRNMSSELVKQQALADEQASQLASSVALSKESVSSDVYSFFANNYSLIFVCGMVVGALLLSSLMYMGLGTSQVPASQVPASQVPASQVPASQVPASQVPVLGPNDHVVKVLGQEIVVNGQPEGHVVKVLGQEIVVHEPVRTLLSRTDSGHELWTWNEPLERAWWHGNEGVQDVVWNRPPEDFDDPVEAAHALYERALRMFLDSKKGKNE